jgi:hypothetical protein
VRAARRCMLPAYNVGRIEVDSVSFLNISADRHLFTTIES